MNPAYLFAVLLISLFCGSLAGAEVITVATDGTGQFKSLQAAIDSVPLANAHPQIIQIAPGRYYEKLMVRAPLVHLVGTDAQTTILTFDDYALKMGANGRVIGTNASHTLFVKGNDFEADNLTIENTKVPQKIVHQTMAVGVQADRVIFRHCRFLGHQDTLLAGSGRQYYFDCSIVGDADFIFGDAGAVFDRCEICSNGGGIVTAQERTAPDEPTGYVFSHCRFTSTPDVRKGSVYLGKPFRPCARAILLNCALGDHIAPQGWYLMPEADGSETAYFAEYGSTGAGTANDKRTAWSHQLSAAEAEPFSPATFLQGTDDWRPLEDNAPASQAATRP